MRRQQTMRIANCPHTCLSRAHEKAEAEASAWIKEPMPSLQQAGFGKRVRRALTDDDVVQHSYIDERQRSLQAVGQNAIRARRLSASRRMLVRKYHRAGIQLQCPLHDNTRINRGRIERALEHRLIGQHPVLTGISADSL